MPERRIRGYACVICGCRTRFFTREFDGLPCFAGKRVYQTLAQPASLPANSTACPVSRVNPQKPHLPDLFSYPRILVCSITCGQQQNRIDSTWTNQSPSSLPPACIRPRGGRSRKAHKKGTCIPDRCLKLILIYFLLLCKFSCPVISLKSLANKEAKTCVTVLINEFCEISPCRDRDLMPDSCFCVIDYKRYIRSL